MNGCVDQAEAKKKKKPSLALKTMAVDSSFIKCLLYVQPR